MASSRWLLEARTSEAEYQDAQTRVRGARITAARWLASRGWLASWSPLVAAGAMFVGQLLPGLVIFMSSAGHPHALNFYFLCIYLLQRVCKGGITANFSFKKFVLMPQ